LDKGQEEGWVSLATTRKKIRKNKRVKCEETEKKEEEEEKGSLAEETRNPLLAPEKPSTDRSPMEMEVPPHVDTAASFSAVVASDWRLHLTMVSTNTRVSSGVLPGGTSTM